jgi:ACT domain-containing protein
MELSDERIKNIINQYERKRTKERERYELIKDTDEFKNRNRERARNHYQLNKDKKKEKYDNNKEFMNSRSSYYYYKRMNKLDIFKEKYPNKVKILSENNIHF